MKDFLEGTSDAQLLREDLAELKRRFGGDGKIHMELNFSSRYPIEPPMIRVVSPRMLQYTGNVTIGGAVCSEFLAGGKYDPDFEISEIMRMVRLNMLTAPKVVVTTQFGPGGRAGPLRVDLNGRDHLGSPLREYVCFLFFASIIFAHLHKIIHSLLASSLSLFLSLKISLSLSLTLSSPTR